MSQLLSRHWRFQLYSVWLSDELINEDPARDITSTQFPHLSRRGLDTQRQIQDQHSIPNHVYGTLDTLVLLFESLGGREYILTTRHRSGHATTQSGLFRISRWVGARRRPGVCVQRQGQGARQGHSQLWQVAPLYPVSSQAHWKLCHVCEHFPPCSQWLGTHLSEKETNRNKPTREWDLWVAKFQAVWAIYHFNARLPYQGN